MTATELMNLINTEYLNIVNNVMFNKLGVKVDMYASRIGKGYTNCAFLYDRRKSTDVGDVERKMRGNKLLRHLFRNADIEIVAYDYEEDNCIGFWVSVYYGHNDGGSNGHSLLTFYVNKDTKKIIYRY